MKITSIHTAGATGSNRTPFATLFFCGGSAFISTSTSVKRTRPKEWLSYLGLSSRFLSKGVWVTQGLLCIPPGVALDKTPSIKKPDLIRFFREGRQPLNKVEIEQRRKELDNWDALVEKAINSLQPSSILRDMADEVIVPLILPWLSSRPQLLGILDTSPHTPCIYIPRKLLIAVWH